MADDKINPGDEVTVIIEDPTFEQMLGMALESQEKFIPKDGANLVGSDSHESPQDSLYLIRHYDSEGDAKKAQAGRKKRYPDEDTYIYTPD